MKEIKNVHVVVKYFYPVAAGIETNIMETYSVLAKKGWNITIHTSLDILTKKNCLSDEEEIRGLHVKRYPFTWFGYWPKIDWSSADVVCLHNFNIVPHLYIFLYTLWLKMRGKKNFALILTPHGGFNPEWSIFPRLIAPVKSLYHYTVGAWLTNISADGVRAVSLWERNAMIDKGLDEKKVAIIDNGLEDEAYVDIDAEASEDIQKQVSVYGRYLIQIGRVYPIKNYETVIYALPKLPDDVKYVIAGPVGDEKYLAYLESIITELGLQERVIFAGVIRGVDKYYLIKHAEMMVHMALWESFCNVVHEGLSQGLVCIVANNTALPLLVKDGVNGYCIETKDSDAVAEKIQFVLDNKMSDTIVAMEQRNREYGLKNSWQEVACRMKDFYETVLKHIYDTGN